MTSKYYGNWECFQDMKHDFCLAPEFDLTDDNILFAWYEYLDYSGNATVILIDNNGQLCEVEGSHCSCYGLEGQWKPQPVDWHQIAMRPVNYYTRQELIDLANQHIN